MYCVAPYTLLNMPDGQPNPFDLYAGALPGQYQTTPSIVRFINTEKLLLVGNYCREIPIASKTNHGE